MAVRGLGCAEKKVYNAITEQGGIVRKGNGTRKRGRGEFLTGKAKSKV